MKGNKIIKIVRAGLLALFVILITVAAYFHQTKSTPSIHALCPFGGLESLYKFLAEGNYIQKVFQGTMLLFAITIVLAVFFKRSFCGLLCPFGAIQEFFGKIGIKIFKRRLLMPVKADRVLRYLKYVVLLITVGYAWKTAGLWMAPYDPWSAYGHLSTGLAAVWEEAPVGLILLGVTIIGSLVYDRFFCKYLCPMGALYAIIGKISFFKISRNADICIDCGKCNKVCPVNIDVQHGKDVKSAECIDCQLCVLDCPKAGALEIKEGRKIIKPVTAIVLVMGVFFGSIWISQAAGIYTFSTKVEAGAGMALRDVVGSMTIQEVSDAANIELKEVYEKMKIPADVPAETKLKEIKLIAPDYDFHKVKESLEKGE
ncbi:MAG: 4Fe-4S binding protein [Spirochaetes bacterium]|nr:4Fe-4S binding protein [Spirochaetota bacterium]